MIARTICFIFDTPHYLGGKYYLSSIISSLSQLSMARIVVLTGRESIYDDFVTNLPQSVEVFRLAYFDETGFDRLFFRLFRFFGFPCIFRALADKYSIDTFSHSEAPNCKKGLYETINWIPDLQFVELPENFSILQRLRSFLRVISLIRQSKIILFSSLHSKSIAIKYFSRFSNTIELKSFVLNFTPNLHFDSSAYTSEHDDLQKPLPDKYLFMPNQFWTHKNHYVALEGFAKFVKDYPNFFLILTGNPRDFRNQNYASSLERKLRDGFFGPNVLYLGVLGRSQYYRILENCSVLVNPSLYEGWSTTVEEGIFLQKCILVSNIGVHREQVKNYAKSYCFEKTSPDDFCTQLVALINSTNNDDDFSSSNRKYRFLESLRLLYRL